MRKEMPKIKVKDVQTDQVLFECALEESEKAYAHAAHLEEMGLDVKVIDPTLSETLTASLGLGVQEVRRYEESLAEEMENHEGSCCFEDTAPTDKKNLH